MVNLTYGSLNSVVTQDPAERGSLASWRLLFAYIGSTLMVQLVTRCEPVLSAKYPNMGYFILAVIFAVFCIPMQILCAKSQKEVVPPQPSPKKIGIFKSLAISFKNREFMIVCILFLRAGLRSVRRRHDQHLLVQVRPRRRQPDGDLLAHHAHPLHARLLHLPVLVQQAQA